MKRRARRARFDREPNSFKIAWFPWITVMLAAMVPILPFVVIAPISPPWGFMLFLAWRLIQREVWYPWAGAALGFYDDMWSGQPLGSSILIWSLTLFALDLVDRRMLWRDYWQDWALGTIGCVLALSAELWIANQTGGHTRVIHIIPQIALSILVFPLVMRLCARADQWRFS